MKSAYILAAYRTPGGKAGRGSFRTMRPDDLAADIIAGLIERTGVDPLLIDDVVLGCAFPEGEQGLNVARIATLKAGLPYQVPAQTINRFCASGLQSIAIAAERICAGGADCIIAGGTESMSMIPMGGNKYSPNSELFGQWPEVYSSMGMTAERVAKQYQISRHDQDQFACGSHKKAAEAIAAGYFNREIIPVEVEQTTMSKGKVNKSSITVKGDEGVREETTIESLAKLESSFKRDGTVTAGNASQMTDGAAALLVVSEKMLKRLGAHPLARFVAYVVKGVPPEIMGIGPIEAIPAALKMAGIRQRQLDHIELNEAFAAQSLAVMRELNLDPERVNPHGGAIALGHPLGCTGAKLATTLIHAMRREDHRYGMVTMCIGGGMGAAGIFERL